MKVVVACFILFPIFSFAQSKGWQLKDLDADHEFGISLTKAYELLKNKKHKKVIVAVIDSGIDTAHEDLKTVLSPDGWGLLGNANGENIQYENYEYVRILKPLKMKFGNARPADTTGNSLYQTLNAKYLAETEKAAGTVRNIKGFKRVIDSVVLAMNTASPTADDFKKLETNTRSLSQLKTSMVKALGNSSYETFYQNSIMGPLEHYEQELDRQLNLDYDARKIIGDDPDNIMDNHYGNHDLMGPDAHHGTHVAGIIGAVRGNGIGIDGVADDVEIMSIRAVPDGDERDKDVANAIRYAVKHGAKVINMSFGKAYATNKEAVDKAVKYARKHDVLIVQAAGNEGKNIDSIANFPMRDNDKAENWIVVGASGPKDDATLAAGFSNYGLRSVDVFAPGVRIYSSVPGSKYDTYDGTSMAAPVVAGLAALIREYYPKLKAAQVKEVIMQSVVKRNVLTNKCVTGGVVSAAQALKMTAAK
ncbi:MAG: S8 family serine peptidase [Bacteroidota bacterium]